MFWIILKFSVNLQGYYEKIICDYFNNLKGIPIRFSSLIIVYVFHGNKISYWVSLRDIYILNFIKPFSPLLYIGIKLNIYQGWIYKVLYMQYKFLIILKEGLVIIGDNVDETGEYFAEWNKPGTQRHVEHDFIHLPNINIFKPTEVENTT